MNTTSGVPLLGAETWVEVAKQPDRLVVIAVGSMEQHGPHLPLSTDTVVAEHLASRLGLERSDVVVGPTIPVGASGEHQDFPGTLSIGTEALAQVLKELVRSARESFRGVIIVSGHGGNNDALREIEAVANQEGDPVLCFLPRVDGGDAHAGRTETSVLLALSPADVHLDQAAVGATQPLGEIIDEIRHAGVSAVSENGVLGDPTGATRDEGLGVLEAMWAQLQHAVAERFGE